MEAQRALDRGKKKSTQMLPLDKVRTVENPEQEGPMLTFEKIFSPEEMGNFWTRNSKKIMTFTFKKPVLFFVKNGSNSRSLVIITLTPCPGQT
jgi:hypothetical protein